MLMACRRFALFFSGCLITCSVIAASDSHPKGFWILKNTDSEIPFGSLRLDQSDHFELLVYDSGFKVYIVEGAIRQKNDSQWELKDSVDNSNTFLMSRDGNELKLVDTENQHLLFAETTENKLKKAIIQYNHKNK